MDIYNIEIPLGVNTPRRIAFRGATYSPLDVTSSALAYQFPANAFFTNVI
jgi:hypothetical protein